MRAHTCSSGGLRVLLSQSCSFSCAYIVDYIVVVGPTALLTAPDLAQTSGQSTSNGHVLPSATAESGTPERHCRPASPDMNGHDATPKRASHRQTPNKTLSESATPSSSRGTPQRSTPSRTATATSIHSEAEASHALAQAAAVAAGLAAASRSMSVHLPEPAVPFENGAHVRAYVFLGVWGPFHVDVAEDAVVFVFESVW